MIKIIPSILTNNPEEFRQLLSLCEGIVERVHVDVIDGIFADNKTVDLSILNDYEGNLKFDIHLMVKDPINWVEKCVRAGADRVIGQIEKMSDQKAFMEKVTESGTKVGFGLDLKTPISEIENNLLRDLDLILVMSVPAGFGGQEFDANVEQKIVELDHIRASDMSPFLIQDDGGLTLNKIDDVHVVGVDEAVIGRKLFEGELADNIEKFEKAAHGF